MSSPVVSLPGPRAAPTAVTVSSAGVASALAIGIVDNHGDERGQERNNHVNVIPVPVGTVTVSPPTASVLPTQTVALSATVKDANGTVVTDRPVDVEHEQPVDGHGVASGVVTGVAPGTATITATAKERVDRPR